MQFVAVDVDGYFYLFQSTDELLSHVEDPDEFRLIVGIDGRVHSVVLDEQGNSVAQGSIPVDPRLLRHIWSEAQSRYPQHFPLRRLLQKDANVVKELFEVLELSQSEGSPHNWLIEDGTETLEPFTSLKGVSAVVLRRHPLTSRISVRDAFGHVYKPEIHVTGGLLGFKRHILFTEIEQQET